jgi:hypothetical protein
MPILVPSERDGRSVDIVHSYLKTVNATQEAMNRALRRQVPRPLIRADLATKRVIII